MIARALGGLFTVALAVIALYVSPYWVFRLWDRGGLFDIGWLRPQGDLVAQWLRGTPFQPYDIPLWGIGVFLTLTALQWLWRRLFGG